MLVLDENISRITEKQLREWGIRTRVVGDHFLPEDTEDENIMPLLHRLKGPTFFTHDEDFYRRNLWHAGYALAWLDLPQSDAARFIRAFPAFDTKTKRLGKVIRIHPHELRYFDSRHGPARRTAWLRPV